MKNKLKFILTVEAGSHSGKPDPGMTMRYLYKILKKGLDDLPIVNRWARGTVKLEYLSEDPKLKRRIEHLTPNRLKYLRKRGLTVWEIALMFNCSKETIWNRLKEDRLKTQKEVI